MSFYAESAISVHETENTEGKYFKVSQVTDATNFVEMAYDFIAETSEYENRLLEGIGRFELNEFRENGEVVYSEGALGTVWKKVKKIFKFIKDWVIAVWKRFVAWFDKFFKGDSAFLNKYKNAIDENGSYIKDDYETTIPLTKAAFETYCKGTPEDINARGYENIKETMATLKSADGDLVTNKDSLDKDLDNISDGIDDIKDKYENLKEKTDVDKSWIIGQRDNIKAYFKVKVSDYEKKKTKILKDIDNMDKLSTDILKEKPNLVSTSRAIVSKYRTMVALDMSNYIEMIKLGKKTARKLAMVFINAKPLPKYKRESAFEHSDLDAYLNF